MSLSERLEVKLPQNAEVSLRSHRALHAAKRNSGCFSHQATPGQRMHELQLLVTESSVCMKLSHLAPTLASRG